jgi:3'(2'), 5'-bisphosphate nucleotidase
MQMELDVAKTLALRAGAILLKHYSAPAVRWKGLGNPVTEADRAASAFLVKELKQLFPGDGILCEEEPDDAQRLSKSRVWIIDPMDGTKEFIDHRDEFAVMIGLAVHGIPSLGVVYQPTTEKLYYARTGSGAFVTAEGATRMLQVSPESNPLQMTIALSRSHHSSNVDLVRRRLEIHKFIASGSLGLKVGLIAEGLAHLYVHVGLGTNQWDTCAPQAILHEAGGRMTDTSNAALPYSCAEPRNLLGVIASNGTIHDRIVETTQSVLAEP